MLLLPKQAVAQATPVAKGGCGGGVLLLQRVRLGVGEGERRVRAPVGAQANLAGYQDGFMILGVTGIVAMVPAMLMITRPGRKVA